MGCGQSRQIKRQRQLLKLCGEIERVICNRQSIQENTIRTFVLGRKQEGKTLSREDKRIIFSYSSSVKLMSYLYTTVVSIRTNLQDSLVLKNAVKLIGEMDSKAKSLIDGIDTRLTTIATTLRDISEKKEAISALLDRMSTEDVDESRVDDIVKQCLAETEAEATKTDGSSLTDQILRQDETLEDIFNDNDESSKIIKEEEREEVELNRKERNQKKEEVEPLVKLDHLQPVIVM